MPLDVPQPQAPLDGHTRAVTAPASQEALHQAYLDAGKRLKELLRGGAEKKEIEKQREAVDRAKALWHRASQAQRGALRGRGR